MSEREPSAPEKGEAGFLQRWSQRKHAARLAEDEPPVPAPPQSAEDAGAPAADEFEALEEAEAPAPPIDADMPPLDSLNEDSDYSGFLSAGVSEALRTAALRKLFHSPKFNVRDGLCEYDHDYTAFKPLGDVETADMRLLRERLEERARRLLAEASDGADVERADDEPRAAEPSETGREADTPPEDDDDARA